MDDILLLVGVGVGVTLSIMILVWLSDTAKYTKQISEDLKKLVGEKESEEKKQQDA